GVSHIRWPTLVSPGDPMMAGANTDSPRARGDWPFFLALGVLGGVYVILLLAMLIADMFYTSPSAILAALRSPEIRYAIRLSLISSLITAQIALWIAVPIGYLMSRCEFPSRCGSMLCSICRSYYRRSYLA